MCFRPPTDIEAPMKQVCPQGYKTNMKQRMKPRKTLPTSQGYNNETITAQGGMLLMSQTSLEQNRKVQ